MADRIVKYRLYLPPTASEDGSSIVYHQIYAIESLDDGETYGVDFALK